MNESINKSMNAKPLMIILGVFSLVFTVVGNIVLFIDRYYSWYGSGYGYEFDFPGVANTIWAIFFFIVALVFSFYMFKGKRVKTGAIPTVCVFWVIIETLYMPIYAIENISRRLTLERVFDFYTSWSWVEMFLFIVSLIVILVCANMGFSNKALFAVFGSIALLMQLIRFIRVLEYAEYYFDSFLNFLYFCGKFAPFLIMTTLFIFGLANRTIDEEHEQAAPSAPQGRYYNGVYIHAQSVAESGRNPYAPVYAPPAPVAAPQHAPPQYAPQNVAYAPTYSQPVQQPAPVQIISPEQKLLFLKQSFESGEITEEEYLQRRDRILREDFGR